MKGIIFFICWVFIVLQLSASCISFSSGVDSRLYLVLLLIATIPAFLMFLFCQNIIMRGIVVPSEK